MDWDKLRQPEQKDGYHRHKNPDGSIGGWVSDDSTVEPTAYVAPEAEVSFSRILGKAQILDAAKVISSTVKDNAILKDRASASGSLIKGDAELSGCTVTEGNGSVINREHPSVIIGGDAKVQNLTVRYKDGCRIELDGGTFECNLPADHDGLFPPGLRVLGTAEFPGSPFKVEELVALARTAQTEFSHSRDAIGHVRFTVPRGEEKFHRPTASASFSDSLAKDKKGKDNDGHQR